jgi:hypothetical protein
VSINPVQRTIHTQLVWFLTSSCSLLNLLQRRETAQLGYSISVYNKTVIAGAIKATSSGQTNTVVLHAISPIRFAGSNHNIVSLAASIYAGAAYVYNCE